VNKDLESAEKEFSQFASKNAAIDVKAQGVAMVEAAAALQGQLIAAQSESEGLRQIYSDNNVRVRSVKARIDELQHQLEKLGGKGESTTTVSASQASPCILRSGNYRFSASSTQTCIDEQRSGSGPRDPHERVRDGEGPGSERNPDGEGA